MAFTSYHNVRGATSQDWILVEAGDNASDIKSILLTNVDASASATIDLSIRNISNTYYLIKNIVIPFRSSLLLNDNRILSFSNATGQYSLVITVGTTDEIDVIIKR